MRHRHVAPRDRRESRQLELVDVRRDGRGRAVHLLGERARRQIPDELARLFDIADAVLRPSLANPMIDGNVENAPKKLYGARFS
ncbi:hypothetical protein PTKU64_45430 [Paraburkholderia terrae]|uniref:Uncharacterized protein n=1 Tax=Paraburkholderia terrae TaxID=311230 RepID=A0ABN6JKQ0_9BURK|nr:hypothetical protein PTKU64_45430 [Paraburkholderia terrae]